MKIEAYLTWYRTNPWIPTCLPPPSTPSHPRKPRHPLELVLVLVLILVFSLSPLQILLTLLLWNWIAPISFCGELSSYLLLAAKAWLASSMVPTTSHLFVPLLLYLGQTGPNYPELDRGPSPRQHLVKSLMIMRRLLSGRPYLVSLHPISTVGSDVGVRVWARNKRAITVGTWTFGPLWLFLTFYSIQLRVYSKS